MFGLKNSGGPAVETSNGYFAVQDGSDKGKYKTFFISLIIAMGFILSMFLVVFLVFSDNPTTQPDDYDNVPYDVSNEDTGGDGVFAPGVSSLNFLKEFGISDDAIDYIEQQVKDSLDKHYYISGYNEIYYNAPESTYSSDSGKLTFSLTTDTGKYTFYVTSLFDNTGQVTSVSIAVYTDDGSPVM